MRRLVVCLAPLLVTSTAAAIDVRDTRLVADPAVSARHVAFVYAGDVWIANLDGSGVRRLTSHVGEERNPRFSPDGSLLAFSGQYDGNTDVYVVPVEGGEPRRLTWHPGDDLVQGFTPDGSAVVFTSPREVYTRRHAKLYTVPVAGGMETRLPLPHAFKAVHSPDGSRIAYVPLYEAFRQWKNYRGGTTTRIWLYDVATHAVEQLPQPAERCNDTDPMWVRDTLYFLSDRNGELNLFSWKPGSAGVEQLTRHEDFPVLAASAGGGRIIYEQAGYLHLFDLSSRQNTRLRIGITADLPEARARFAKGSKWVRNGSISPSGARAVLGFRGEIVTVPAEKGDPRNLTNSPGVHEHSPAWSPDGRSIAYFADAGGEYSVHVKPQDGKGEAKVFKPGGTGFYGNLRWSPDGTKLSYSDNSFSLYWLEVGSGKVRRISSEVLYSPTPTLTHAWAPDSAWIAYTRNTESNLQQVWLYSLAQDRSFPLGDALTDVGEPVFDASGKYLYVVASTDAGPVRDWFAQSNADMILTNDIYLVVLARDIPSPLARASDEEKGKTDDKPAGDSARSKPEAPRTPVVRVDLDGLDQRVLPLGVKGTLFSSLAAGEPGKLYYLKFDQGRGRRSGERAGTLCRFDLDKREEEVVIDKITSFEITPDGKKVLARQQDNWIIGDAKGKLDASKGRLAIEGIQVRVEPRSEWAQIFDEAWRINRDYFYAPNFHGADWPAMRQKYAALLPHLATRSDLNRVIQWMCSELAVGHHRGGGGDNPSSPDRVPGGLLGADFEVAAGRYRFARVLGGLNWNPELRSPLTEPGVDVKAGEYLLAVEGRDLAPPENLFARFENTAGRTVEITVGPDPSGKGSRTLTVVPIESDLALRNRDWVEGNIRKVHAATSGRVAYVHVPDTAGQGHTYFKRYFYPQAQKEAIIVDERHNGGGSVADYYIDHLRRPFIAWWAMRYGQDLPTPQAAIHGPKAMIIDETAGSGGDLLPWMFRKLGLGTLVGRRTWGGLVGILGFPTLMDGGMITAPNLAIWTEDGGFVVENEGVPPDIEVEQLPADVIAGRDPQLEKAIEVVMKQLPPTPPARPTRPPYPVRAR